MNGPNARSNVPTGDDGVRHDVAEPSTEADPEPPEARAGRVTRGDVLRAITLDKLVLVAAIFLVVLLIAAIFAPMIAPYDPVAQNLVARNSPPLSPGVVAPDAPMHIFGTDPLGRDTFSRTLYGARVSVSVGFIGALVSALIGVSLGLIAGFYRGRVDDVIMRMVDGMMAVPSLLVALFVLFILGGGLVNLIVVFALVRWMVYARVVRGITLSFRETGYIEAARAIGCRGRSIVTRHVWPNARLSVLVVFTLEVAVLILGEAALSFLGFGVSPPTPSWGNMIADGREYITSAWWLIVIPGMAIFFTTLSLNLLAGWVRNVTDPAQRWRWLKVVTED